MNKLVGFIGMTVSGWLGWMRGDMVSFSVSVYVAVAAAFPNESAAQTPDHYLPGGTVPGTTASVFAPGIVSGSYEEYGVAVTEDWSDIYFTSAVGERSTIAVVHRVDRTWGSPFPASFSGQENDSHPWLDRAGDRIYFVSRRPCPGSTQDLNLLFVERVSGDWTAPTCMDSPVIDQTVHAPSVSANGTIYATGLIRLRANGAQYLPAERLTPDIRGSHPAVAPDESYIVFSARRNGGLGGKDLYVVFRLQNDLWSDPVNLGPGVNTNIGESSPTLSSDGRFLFFSRGGDVWWVDIAVVDDHRPG